MTFRVIDTKTGKEPDQSEIALRETWAQSLIWCDMDGFVLHQDGDLYLTDECGGMALCPEGRFRIQFVDIPLCDPTQPSRPISITFEFGNGSEKVEDHAH